MMTALSEPTGKLSYSIPEAASATSLSRTKLYDMIKNKDLRVTRIGGRTIIPASALLALIEGHAQ